MCRSSAWVVLLVAALLVVSCVPASPPATPTATDTVTASPTPTATIVWFPSTATPTPRPTQQVTPTPDLRPGIGDLLLEDGFKSPENWQLSSSVRGNVAIGNNRLTIATSQARTLLFSLRDQPLMSNFYLEVTAQTNLCSGSDEYGLYLRVASAADFYRFSLSCDGQVRLDKIVNGQASSPQPWTPSGAFPPGAPSQTRLGVWASGREMRFFVNDQHQFSISDPILPEGQIGLFARSSGETAVSVSFSELEIYTLEQ